ncbi:hypothetical protein [Amycolatopsis sp. NPDC051903]|uniref:hypothetical protein n=1 Tax=Amycolatopsis sp. NPDC051903 TaxID=3363936 RepID=UPI0037B5FCD1
MCEQAVRAVRRVMMVIMGGGVFERAELAVARQRARAEKVRVLAQAVRLPVLAGVALVALFSSALSGWAWWPWAAGAGVLILLALLRIPARLGPSWTATVVLVIVDAAFVVWYVDPWWWAVLAGVVLTAAAAAAAVRLRLQVRRRETLGALALGVVLLAGGVAGLLVDAAAERAAAERDLQASHDAAVPRILPRTPNDMVIFVVERLTYTRQEQLKRPPGSAPTAAERNWAADACFVLAPAAQRELAAAYGGPDCPGAVEALAQQVRDPLDYANNVWVPGEATSQLPDGSTRVDACRLDFGSITDDTPTSDPGPQLGVLTLQQQQGQGQLVTRFERCPS